MHVHGSLIQNASLHGHILHEGLESCFLLFIFWHSLQALNAKGKGEKGCSAVLGVRECKESTLAGVVIFIITMNSLTIISIAL